MKKKILMESIDDLAYYSASSSDDPRQPYFKLSVKTHKEIIENGLIMSLLISANGRICKDYLSRLLDEKGIVAPDTDNKVFEVPAHIGPMGKGVNLIKDACGHLHIERDGQRNYLSDTDSILLFKALDEQGCFDDAIYDEVDLAKLVQRELDYKCGYYTRIL